MPICRRRPLDLRGSSSCIASRWRKLAFRRRLARLRAARVRHGRYNGIVTTYEQAPDSDVIGDLAFHVG